MNLKSLTTLLALAIIGGCATLPAAEPATPSSQTLYVSPTGDDANAGTADKPLHTLGHARDLVRKINANMTGDITISLAAGTYQLDTPLELTPEDSGTHNHNILYTAAPGATVIISGGIPITNWKQIDATKNLWSAPAPASLKNTRQLYIDGVRASRTRGALPTRLTETSTGYTAASDAMAKWRNPGDIEFIYMGGNKLWSDPSEALGGWTEPRCPVASISGTTITMAQPCFDNSTKRVMLPASFGFKRPANLVGPASFGKSPTTIENAYELLGTPGQFYFDRPASTIYYTPRPGEDLTKADVEAAQLEMLIHGTGTADHPIHNLIFNNIQFSYATWLYPSSGEGFSEIQACYMVTGEKGYATQGLGKLAPGGTFPYGAWTKTPGNISISYGQNIQFTNDAFVHLGAAGLELGNGSQNDLVQGCVFTDISANGLELGGVNLPEAKGADQTTHDRLLDNHLYNIAAEFHGGVAICIGYVQDCLIAHNQLDNLPYAGISIGWGGWPDKIEQAGQPNYSQHNLIANNLIFHHMTINADGGAIYTQGLTGPSLPDGERIEGNVIYDQFNTGHGIYTDNGCKNVTATGNVIFHTNFDNWGTGHKDYYDGNAGKTIDNTGIIGNYWQQGETDSRPNLTLKDNHLISSLDQVPPQIIQAAGLEPEYKNILSKNFNKISAPEAPYRIAAYNGPTYAYISWSPSLFDGGSPVTSYTVHASTGETLTIPEADLWTKGYALLPDLKNAPRSFTITATNAIGTSIESQPSPLLTPTEKAPNKPSAPTSVKIFAGDGAVSIHFQTPANEGGSPIIAFTFTAHPGEKKTTLANRAVISLSGKHTMFGVVGDLKNGQSYTFDVAAVNAAGEGTPVTTPAITPEAHN